MLTLPGTRLRALLELTRVNLPQPSDAPPFFGWGRDEKQILRRVLCTSQKDLRAGTQGLIAFCFLSEDLYLKTRLQFDETAKHLQNLESTTRKAVCAAVKEFNKKQVYTPGSVWRGRQTHSHLPGMPQPP